MTNVPITRSNRPSIGTPELAMIEVTAKKQEPQLAFASSGGVLNELAFARWRGLTTDVPGPPKDRYRRQRKFAVHNKRPHIPSAAHTTDNP